MNDERRQKISRAMRGNQNARGKHNVSPEGRQAIIEAQRRRREREKQEREARGDA